MIVIVIKAEILLFDYYNLMEYSVTILIRIETQT